MGARQRKVACCGRSLRGLQTRDGLAWRRLFQSRARLRGSAATSIVLGAFAMEAMAELQVQVPTGCPSWLFSTFAVCTTLLVSVHMLALVVSSCLLPAVEAAGHARITRLLDECPSERTPRLVALAWSLSTVLGLFLFLVEVALLCWVKFWDVSRLACWAGTAAIAPFIVAFLVFCVHFHREVLQQVYVAKARELGAIESLARATIDSKV